MKRTTKTDPINLYLCLLGVLMVCMVVTGLNGCKFIQVNPSTDVSKYEAFGGTIGIFLKHSHPNTVEKAEPWVKGALAMSDEDLIKNNVMLTAYDFALEEHPEDQAFITMVKGLTDILGFQVVVDPKELVPEMQTKYVQCARGFLKGYSEATK